MRILSIAALVLLLSACKGKDEKAKTTAPETMNTTSVTTTTAAAENTDLSGKWTLVDLDGKQVDPASKNELIGHVTMEFSGNTYTALSPGDNDKGTFTYDAATHKLVTNSTEDGTVETVNVTVDGSKMTVSHEDGTMVFERAN